MSFQYKTGQVPFEKADTTLPLSSLLGYINKRILFPAFGSGRNPLEQRVIKRIRCSFFQDSLSTKNHHDYLFFDLHSITLENLSEYPNLGPKSVKYFYEMYAEHAEPTISTSNFDISKTNEVSGSFEEVDGVVFENYIDKAHEFCIFTLNRQIYIKYCGHLIPFTDIIRFHELEGSEEIMFKLKFRITFITRMDCEINFEQYKKGDPAIIEIGEDDINQVEAQRLIQIFNTFNPS
jgi:hypothetical protein